MTYWTTVSASASPSCPISYVATGENTILNSSHSVDIEHGENEEKDGNYKIVVKLKDDKSNETSETDHVTLSPGGSHRRTYSQSLRASYSSSGKVRLTASTEVDGPETADTSAYCSFTVKDRSPGLR